MPFGFKLSHRLSRTKLFAFAAVLTACEFPTTSPDQSRKIVGRVLVSPDSVTLDPNQTLQFHAFGRTTGGDSVPVSVMWSASVGTITSDGYYTADTSTSDGVVTATYSTTANLIGTSSVKKRHVVAIVLTPPSASMFTGGTQQFTAYGVKNTGDSADVSVTYAATGGTISGSGTYTAGAVPGAFRVIVTQNGRSLADTAQVSVVAAPVAPVASVTVTPALDTVSVGLTRQLAAVTKDAGGGILTGRVVTWASGNPAVATVSGSGLVTAVAPGTAAITATSEGVNGTSTSTVTLILAAIVQVSPPRDTVLPGQTATLTASARDKNGNMLSGHLVTWTSLNPAIASVNASGVVTGIAPGIATIQATVDTASGTAFEQVETVSGAVPWVNEDFSTYISTADLLADPRRLYSVTEDLMASEIVLDRTVGYGTSTQSMRYDFPARAGNCTDYSIGRNINLPAAAADVYIEVVAKFQNGWTNATPGCSGVSNQDYKFILPRVQTSGRFNVMVGTYNTEYTVGYPGNEDGFEGGSVSGIFDGTWHVFRFHAKVGPSGACTLWVDGKLVKDYGVVSMASNLIYGIALGRNINQGPPAAQSLWWGRVRVWNTNPGW